MTVGICSVKGLYRILGEGTPDKCAAIISSASAVDAAKLQGISYVFRQYEDLDRECPGRSFSPEDAKIFADYVMALEDVDTVYCCCDAGESRSPAVAAAVMRWLGMDDLSVWRNPHYHPNMLVFAMLAEALGVAVSDEEQERLFYSNQEAFQIAVDRARQKRRAK